MMSQTSNSDSPSTMRRMSPFWWYTLSLLATFVIVFAYCNRYIHNQPILDDLDYLRLPPWNIQQGLAYWNPAWGWYFRPIFNNYISIVITMFHKNWTNVHLTGFAVAAATVWMLGVLAFRLKGLPAAVIAPMLFLLAGRKDEAISWPAGANSLLAGCFYVATLLCWTLWRQTNRRAWYATSLFAFVLTVCSKDDAISLPIALLILDFGIATKIPLIIRLRQFTPIAILTIIYLVCDVVAYHHAVLSNPNAALFAVAPVLRMNITSHFLMQSFVTCFFETSVLAPLDRLIFAGALVFTIWRVRQRPLFLCLLLIAIIACLPAPLGTGIHSASGRFFFIPIMAVSLMLGVFLDEMLRSPLVQTRIAFASFLSAYLANNIITLRIEDPVMQWMILLVTVLLSAALWRAKLIDGQLALLVLIASIFSESEYMFDANLLSLILPITIVIVGGAMSWRYGIWQDIFALTILMYAPYLSLPLFLISSTILSRKWPLRPNNGEPKHEMALSPQ